MTGETILPDLNKKAPDFKALVNTEETISLKDYKGKNIVLYFYPKDDTPGCTVQACGLRDDIKPIEKLNAIVIGVSPDPVKKHNKFIEKFNLPFLLISDEDKSICEKYGVWVEKSMYGRKYMGVARTTFIIDINGKLVKIFEKVKPKEHSSQVMDFLKSIQ